MKISLITATYNSELNIAACLQSVAGQTRLMNVAGQAHKNIGHIVVHGGSNERTKSLS